MVVLITCLCSWALFFIFFYAICIFTFSRLSFSTFSNGCSAPTWSQILGWILHLPAAGNINYWWLTVAIIKYSLYSQRNVSPVVTPPPRGQPMTSGFLLYMKSTRSRKVNANFIHLSKFQHYNFSIWGFGKNGISHIYLLGNIHAFGMLPRLRNSHSQNHVHV